jgi:hypothetical protein
MVEANKPLYLAEWTLLLAAKKQVIESNQSRRRSRDRWIVLTISSLSCLDSSSTLSFLFCCYIVFSYFIVLRLKSIPLYKM